ncbi:AMP-dependent synthetase [Pelistega indica]|uniref:AMP-dependent synthetase n=1 Tax=Pelistega indica TaxID=1414851 RepID=V8FUP0_9BURK|nr:AMP-binding protein [Pelistega indica]ETD67875.1 AMP-dependent synthetase [Pelistega indica]
MKDYYDSQETQSVEERELHLFSNLRDNLRQLRDKVPALQRQINDIDISTLTSREDLAQIPVVRKYELLNAQTQARQKMTDAKPGDEIERVFGGFSAVGWGQASRVFASPGPLFEPEVARTDYWRMARAMYAAGFRQHMLVHNCFSYHFTPAGSMFETAALAVGATVFPAGVGQTEMQVSVIQDLKPNAYAGTPSFLRIIIEKAEEIGADVSSIKHALFSAEAFPPSLQQWFKEKGVDGYQAYGTADLGLIAYETQAHDGLVIAEDIILEIVKPGTNDPVPDGEVGEVVVTTLNPDYPLLRFGTGDLSVMMAGQSPCGRTNRRIKGWMGRADQSVKVRGAMVHPDLVDKVVKRHMEIKRARLVVTGAMGKDELALFVETMGQPSEQLTQAIQESIKEFIKLRTDVVYKTAGEIKNDGLVIEDARSYE